MGTLFDKGKIGSLELKNRIIMTAIHTGYSMEEETSFLVKRIEGGAAAVTAVMGVSMTGAYSNMGVLDKDMIIPLTEMVRSIHEQSGKLIVQLFHAGRNASIGKLADENAHPVAPSSIPSIIYKDVPKELSVLEIEDVISQFGHSSKICKLSGVDAVEISCSAGYILSEFISPLTNKREDIYGGTLEKRMRFVIEVVQEVRKTVGTNFPVILRVSASDMLGGYGVNETIQLLLKVEKYIDAINVTGGWHESKVPQISMHLPVGGFAFLARMIKQKVKIPVIACNRINNGETANKIIEHGYADFVGCARAFLTDSDFAYKIMSDIPYRRCIGCNKGCIEKVLKYQSATCIFNPGVGHESKLRQKQATSKKRILIVGGGPAGMQAAIEYAKMGENVQLCTSDENVGGKMSIAAKIPYKEAIYENIKSMRYDMEQLGVEICYGVLVDSNYIENYKPDMVVIATGSKPIIPPISGVDQNHVYTAQQVLESDDELAITLLKGEIAIIGGGSLGLETALYLIKKLDLKIKGHEFLSSNANDNILDNLGCQSNITIVGKSERLGKDLGGLRRIILEELRGFGAKLITKSKVDEILENKIVVNNDGTNILLDAEYVILATGYMPQGTELVNWLKINNQYPYYVIGDAKRVGNISKAIMEGYEIMI